jgi:hypothetical protein
MSWSSLLNTSILGRRLGLQIATTNVSGSGASGRTVDLLVGPEELKRGVTTAESTGTNLAAWGVSFVPGTSASSSAVYTLDPPIPGVQKFINFNSTSQGPIYVKTANGETFNSTQGTTFTVLKSTNNQVGVISLMGLTTATWGLINVGLSTATFALTSST